MIRERNRVSIVKNIMNLANEKINMTMMNRRPFQLFKQSSEDLLQQYKDGFHLLPNEQLEAELAPMY